MAETPKNDDNFTFTPVHPFNMEEPKTWSATIGQLHWDNDKIVFSKRSLLEFLKSCQVTVNTNYTEIQKLAEIADPTRDEPKKSSKSSPSPGVTPGATGRPTRKVIDPPGGKQSLKLYGEEYEETDALSLAPPADGGPGVDVEIDRLEHLKLHVEPEADGGAHIEDLPDKITADKAAADKAAADEAARVSNPPPNFRPTRKVRQGPGGATQLGAAFFGGFEDETDADREAARAQTGGKKQQHQQNSGSLW